MMDSERALDHEHVNLSHSSPGREIDQDSTIKTAIPTTDSFNYSQLLKILINNDPDSAWFSPSATS